MMMLASQNSWFRFRDFARTPSLGRSVAAMLVVAFAALILVNVTTFVMMQRTAGVNRTI